LDRRGRPSSYYEIGRRRASRRRRARGLENFVAAASVFATIRPMVKPYQNADISVFWRPERCRHSGICARGLPAVFNPRRRPWIELEHADTDTIVAQVERCPSGALTWAPRDREDAQ
jgi:uncharacterized Fe-S cluster protein YjdI